MADRDEPLTPSTTSRRDFLKKSAAAGAVLWAAPTIASLPAHAQTGSPTPCDGPDVCSGEIGPRCDKFDTSCRVWEVNGECRCSVAVVVALDARNECEDADGTFVPCNGDAVCVTDC